MSSLSPESDPDPTRPHDPDETLGGAASASGGDEATVVADGAGGSDDPGRGLRGRRIGRYVLLEELGRGGQGFVYLAEDQKLRRNVALKIMPEGLAFSPQARLRFEREAEVASRLDHPGICTIYERGEDRGVPFIAMRFVEGETLAAKIAATRADPVTNEPSRGLRFETTAGSSTEESATRLQAGSSNRGGRGRSELRSVLRFLEDAARAVHVAHEAGLVHRDIKPGNIMVDLAGRPVILDFGLARDETSHDATLTLEGDIVGTPSYMAPEQLAEKSMKLDRRADVYALGATLYECVTSQRPFVAETREGLYQAIRAATPEDPRALNPAVSRDLKVVIATAMEKDRNRRYQTALELAEELRRVREFEPIRARPAGVALRLQRWAQRNRALAAAGVVFLVTVTIAFGLVVAAWQEALRLAAANEILAGNEREARAQAEEDAESAKQTADFLAGLFEEVDPLARSGRAFGLGPREGAQLTARELVDRGAAQLRSKLLDRPRVRARLLDTIGNVYVSLALVDQAEPLLTEALELRRRDPGEDHPDFTQSLRSLAALHAARGEPCADEFLSLLARQRALLGDDHPQVGATMRDLAIQLIAEWRHDEAAQLMPEVLSRTTADFGEESRETALMLLCWAQLKILELEPVAAVPHVQRAAKIIDAIEGQTTFSTLLSTFMQAQLTANMGSPALADRLFQQTLQESQALLGEDHFLTAWVVTVHAWFVFTKLQDYDRAAAIGERGLALYEKLYSSSNPLVARRVLELAKYRRAQRRLDEALALLEEGATLCRAGDLRKPQTLGALLYELASLLTERGDPDRAERCLREWVRTNQRILGPRDPQTTEALEVLGASLLARETGRARLDIREPPDGTFGPLYRTARAFARASRLAARSTVAEEGDDFIPRSFADTAMERLAAAVDAGLDDVDRVDGCSDFDELRPRADYEDLLDRIEG